MGHTKKPLAKLLGTAAEYGPIIIFFIVYYWHGLFPATAAIMIVTCVAVPVSYLVEGKIPIVSVFTAVVVGVFGGLTLWLQDETFIKMKPTIIQLFFALALIIGEVFNKNLLKLLIGKAWKMSHAGWKVLTRRFVGFFFLMAIINEIVWRTQTTDFWVNFKVFGIMVLTAIFILSQSSLLTKYGQIDEKTEE